MRVTRRSFLRSTLAGSAACISGRRLGAAESQPAPDSSYKRANTDWLRGSPAPCTLTTGRDGWRRSRWHWAKQSPRSAGTSGSTADVQTGCSSDNFRRPSLGRPRRSGRQRFGRERSAVAPRRASWAARSGCGPGGSAARTYRSARPCRVPWRSARSRRSKAARPSTSAWSSHSRPLAPFQMNAGMLERDRGHLDSSSLLPSNSSLKTSRHCLSRGGPLAGSAPKADSANTASSPARKTAVKCLIFMSSVVGLVRLEPATRGPAGHFMVLLHRSASRVAPGRIAGSKAAPLLRSARNAL
jgi:hypothetical protein